MNKIIGILLGLSIFFGAWVIPAFAEEDNNNNEENDEQVEEVEDEATKIELLQQQIEELRAYIDDLVAQIASLQEAKLELEETLEETLELFRSLQIGMSGDDVKLLQELLATDSDIYPEGLITGYFGPLTQQAVKRFQKMNNIEQVGIVGPKTRARINELLEHGAGKSGKVPPGLLIAPGIRKKFDIEIFEPLPGQTLPPGIAKKLPEGEPAKDIVELEVSDVEVKDVTENSATITWTTNVKANSVVWYDTESGIVPTSTTPVASSTELVLDHEIVLSDLEPGTDYWFFVSSTDDNDQNEISEEGEFTTKEEESENGNNND